MIRNAIKRPALGLLLIAAWGGRGSTSYAQNNTCVPLLEGAIKKIGTSCATMDHNETCYTEALTVTGSTQIEREIKADVSSSGTSYTIDVLSVGTPIQ